MPFFNVRSSSSKTEGKKYTIFFIFLNNRTDHEYVIFSFFVLQTFALRVAYERRTQKKSKLFPTVGRKKCTKLRRMKAKAVVRESQWEAGNIVIKVNMALKCHVFLGWIVVKMIVLFCWNKFESHQIKLILLNRET